MQHPQTQSPPKAKGGSSNRISIVLILLAFAICVLSLAPIFLHHSVNNDLINQAPHQMQYMSTSSKRIGKTSTIETIKYQLGNNEEFNLVFEDEHATDITMPPDIGGAGRFLLHNALQKRSVWDEELDPEYEEERCKKYFTYENYQKNFTDYKARKRRRRVFLGSLIADDSWHALGAIAMETYGVYEAVAFVESNRTQTGTPRKLRFTKGTPDHTILVESNLFGPNTPVLIDYFTYEGEVEGKGLIREHMQRNLIIDLWKKAGMTPDDVGVLTDADETLTRDFLRAVQTCDLPELNPQKQNCQKAKVIVSSMVFEGSPECMTVTRKWMHPDLILGKCIEGIGDERFKLKDEQRQRKFAWRKKEYTQKYGNYSTWLSDWPEENKSECCVFTQAVLPVCFVAFGIQYLLTYAILI